MKKALLNLLDGIIDVLKPYCDRYQEFLQWERDQCSWESGKGAPEPDVYAKYRARLCREHFNSPYKDSYYRDGSL